MPAKRSQAPMDLGDVLLYIAAIFLPPLPIIAKHGCSAQIPLNILLCVLGWIPGVIHAWVVISRNPARPELYPPAY